MTKQEITIEIRRLLNNLTLPERIDIIERIGKKLRQRNSIETARETEQFRREWQKKLK